MMTVPKSSNVGAVRLSFAGFGNDAFMWRRNEIMAEGETDLNATNGTISEGRAAMQFAAPAKHRGRAFQTRTLRLPTMVTALFSCTKPPTIRWGNPADLKSLPHLASTLAVAR